MFDLNSRFSCWRRPKYQLLHKYVTSVYCTLCSLCHVYAHLVIYIQMVI